MNPLFVDQLKSNYLRFFNKNYSYDNLIKKSVDEGMPIIISMLLMNILFVALAIITDCVDLMLEIPYWWSLLVRLPMILFSIVNFRIWQNKKTLVLDLLVLSCSIFVPIYSAFVLIYMMLRTCLDTVIYQAKN